MSFCPELLPDFQVHFSNCSTELKGDPTPEPPNGHGVAPTSLQTPTAVPVLPKHSADLLLQFYPLQTRLYFVTYRHSKASARFVASFSQPQVRSSRRAGTDTAPERPQTHRIHRRAQTSLRRRLLSGTSSTAAHPARALLAAPPSPGTPTRLSPAALPLPPAASHPGRTRQLSRREDAAAAALCLAQAGAARPGAPQPAQGRLPPRYLGPPGPRPPPPAALPRSPGARRARGGGAEGRGGQGRASGGRSAVPGGSPRRPARAGRDCPSYSRRGTWIKGSAGTWRGQPTSFSSAPTGAGCSSPASTATVSSGDGARSHPLP